MCEDFETVVWGSLCRDSTLGSLRRGCVSTLMEGRGMIGVVSSRLAAGVMLIISTLLWGWCVCCFSRNRGYSVCNW